MGFFLHGWLYIVIFFMMHVKTRSYFLQLNVQEVYCDVNALILRLNYMVVHLLNVLIKGTIGGSFK